MVVFHSSFHSIFLLTSLTYFKVFFFNNDSFKFQCVIIQTWIYYAVVTIIRAQLKTRTTRFHVICVVFLNADTNRPFTVVYIYLIFFQIYHLIEITEAQYLLFFSYKSLHLIYLKCSRASRQTFLILMCFALVSHYQPAAEKKPLWQLVIGLSTSDTCQSRNTCWLWLAHRQWKRTWISCRSHAGLYYIP